LDGTAIARWGRRSEKTPGTPGATNFWGEEKRTDLKVGHHSRRYERERSMLRAMAIWPEW
jgi:hypothetical protein